MELTKIQIQEIAGFLNDNDITYVDMRLETYDHIVTDIEDKIRNQNMDFDTAFTGVTNSWKKYIRETSSFYFGIYFSAPKLVIDKAKKSFKKFYFLYLSAYFLPLIFIQYLKVPLFIKFTNTVYPFIEVLGVCATIFFLFLMIKKWRSKEKTVYSFILKTQTTSLAFGFIVSFKYLFTANNDLNINAIWIAFNLAFLASTYTYFHFCKKHKEAIKKYKIL